MLCIVILNKIVHYISLYPRLIEKSIILKNAPLEIHYSKYCKPTFILFARKFHLVHFLPQTSSLMSFVHVFYIEKGSVLKISHYEQFFQLWIANQSSHNKYCFTVIIIASNIFDKKINFCNIQLKYPLIRFWLIATISSNLHPFRCINATHVNWSEILTSGILGWYRVHFLVWISCSTANT